MLVFGVAVALVVGFGLLAALLVDMARADRRAAARLRGPAVPGERRVWTTVAALLQREHAELMPMYPGPPIGGVRPVQGAAVGRHAGGA